MINYNDYPCLLFLSYDKDTAPSELPFKVAHKGVQEYLSERKGYQEMFAYVAVKNTLLKEDSTTNYLLNDKMFAKIDSDDRFRNENFQYFFRNYIKAKYGTILFRNGGQYVYLLLGKQESKSLKKCDGRYICSALFKNNFFIGFEEGVITEKGIQVFPNGYYESGMPIGGYLSFVIVTLAYASKTELPLYESEKIKEKIYIL